VEGAGVAAEDERGSTGVEVADAIDGARIAPRPDANHVAPSKMAALLIEYRS
jgi:hypothetical protein